MTMCVMLPLIQRRVRLADSPSLNLAFGYEREDYNSTVTHAGYSVFG